MPNTPSNADGFDFHGKAVVLASEKGPEKCVIDCQNQGRAFYFHNGEGPDSVVGARMCRFLYVTA